MKKIGILFFIFILVVQYTFPQALFAFHRMRVLGVATQASELVVPPVTAGTGLLLPDSPFYFLDIFYENVKLAFTFSPEGKAKLHNQVAQERLAELRVMLAKNNDKGITTALSQLEKEDAAAAAKLHEASAKGKDVKELAKLLNDSMKTQRDVLNTTIEQADGALQLRLKATREELRNSKASVEDQLPEDVLMQEVEASLKEDINTDLNDLSQSGASLQQSTDQLTILASEAAKQNQVNREAAIKQVILNQNQVAQQQQAQIYLEAQKQQQQNLILQQAAAQQVQQSVRQAQEAALRAQQQQQIQQQQQQIQMLQGQQQIQQQQLQQIQYQNLYR